MLRVSGKTDFSKSDNGFIKFKVGLDDSGLVKDLEAMAKRSQNFVPWFGVFVSVYRAAHEIHFTGGGSLGRVSGMWNAPYSRRYREQKKAKVGHLKKEFLTDDLYHSLTSQTPNTFLVVSNDSVTIGSQVKADRPSGQFNYPATQQYGAKTKLGQHSKEARKRRPSEMKQKLKARIPPRPPVITNWPSPIIAGLSSSLLEYMTTGRVRMPRF